MFGCLSSRGSGATPTLNVPTVVPTMEEHKAAALQQLRALRSYEIDTKKKQTIATDLVRQGFDANDPIEAIDHQEIRLLDLAFKEMDYDFAHFLVERGANPRLCTEVAWFTDRMQELFDGLPSVRLNALSAVPATSGVVTSVLEVQTNIKNASERDLGRFLCDMATFSMRMSAVGVGGALYGVGVTAGGAGVLISGIPAIVILPVGLIVAGAASIFIDGPIELFCKISQHSAFNLVMGLTACLVGTVPLISLIVRLPLSIVNLASAELIVAGLGGSEQEKRKCREKLSIGVDLPILDMRIESVKAYYARRQLSRSQAQDIANNKDSLSYSTEVYGRKLLLVEDELTAWRSDSRSYSRFVSFITSMNDLMLAEVDQLVLMSKEQRAKWLASRWGIWEPKFDGYVRLESALSTRLTQALHNKDKALALSCCALIREIAPSMGNDAQYNLLHGIRTNGGRGHALGIRASGYQMLCHEDLAFYAEFKTMKTELKTLLNGVKPLLRWRSTNVLEAINHYNHLRQDKSFNDFNRFNCMNACAELLALIPEKDREPLIHSQFSDFIGGYFIDGFFKAAHNVDRELAFSYIDMIRVGAPYLSKETLYNWKIDLTWRQATKGLFEDPAFCTLFQQMKERVVSLLDGWTPPLPPPSDSYAN